MTPAHRSLVLLLTATVDPGATPLVVRADPLLRLRDYQEALSIWLSSGTVRKIVVFENSGYDLSSLKKLALRFPDHEVEFHSFLGNQDGAVRGKGYAELSGIARTLDQSKLIDKSSVIVKCTGRLTVSNAGALFRSIADREFDIMCTLKHALTFADSRLFAATPAFVSRYLLPQQAIINDGEGVFLEHALACAAARAVSDRKRWIPFPVFPDIRGISGTHGVTLSNGAGKRAVKSLYHRLRNFVYER